MLYICQIPKWDLSKGTSAGAPLKTFGGRASKPRTTRKSFFSFV